MPNLTGSAEVIHNDTISTDATQQVALGTRARDVNANEYIYLLGTAALVGGTWVHYNLDTGTTEKMTAGAVRPVAISGTSITAGLYGWFQIFGKNTLAATDTVAALKQLYIDGTAGRADDLAVSGDAIVNAISLTADTSNVATVFIQYPYTLGTGISS